MINTGRRANINRQLPIYANITHLCFYISKEQEGTANAKVFGSLDCLLLREVTDKRVNTEPSPIGSFLRVLTFWYSGKCP